MLVFCRRDLDPPARAAIERAATTAGFVVQRVGPDLLALFGEGDPSLIDGLSGVERIAEGHGEPILAARGAGVAASMVTVGPVRIGSGFTVIAGPCAVEDRVRLLEIAHAASEAGADILRGGAFKPRTSPYSFRGLGRPGLALLAEAREATGLPIVTEVLDTRDVDAVAEVADLLQIGSRNMMNYALLVEAGRAGKPVLLKRGMAATLKELLLAAEYLLLSGAAGVVLCERGIRTFNDELRNTLDLAAVPVLAQATHLPVMVDPSHATGRREFVPAMARAAAAAGAAGVMLEIHGAPEDALSDGRQAVDPDTLAGLVRQLREIARIAGTFEDEEEKR